MSQFTAPLLAMTAATFALFADALTVDGVAGVGVVTTDNGVQLGQQVDVYNGTRLSVRKADFPGITWNSVVVHSGTTYVVTEIQTVTADGIVNATLVKS